MGWSSQIIKNGKSYKVLDDGDAYKANKVTSKNKKKKIIWDVETKSEVRNV